ncbi:MAG: 5-(carboxyamino)imidazole ribonucleotide synthase [Nitriliruptoraceae bacterium]
MAHHESDRDTSFAAVPGASVGIIGGGQLARMTHRAAIDLGITVHVLCPDEHEPAPAAGARWHQGTADDQQAFRTLAAAVDAITLDHELVSRDGLERLVNDGYTVRPSPTALAFAQDKLFARSALGDMGFPVPSFTEVTEAAQVGAFAAVHGWPVVLKARSGGYDGRGVELVSSVGDARTVLSRGGNWLAETFVPIATEVAVVIARRPGGQTVTYPVVETVQVDGICVELVMPARIDDAVAASAIELGTSIAHAIEVTGILAVEMFITPDGELVINEVATRPHNSGHATIEGSVTSQFSNHLRAVLDWPLGSTAMISSVAVTVNLLGGDQHVEPTERLDEALEDPDVHVHLYGKGWRPGRKLGHVTVTGDDADTVLAAARRAAAVLIQP